MVRHKIFEGETVDNKKLIIYNNGDTKGTIKFKRIWQDVKITSTGRIVLEFEIINQKQKTRRRRKILNNAGSNLQRTTAEWTKLRK